MLCKLPARPLALVFATLLASIGFALGTARTAHAALPAADPNQIQFTLEGCRPTSPFLFTGSNLCPDSDYTTGNLGKFWNEGDLVPFRVTLKNNDGNQHYAFEIAADYRLGNALGYDYITTPVLNTALSDASCPALSSSGLSYTSGAAAAGGADETIFRTEDLTQLAGTKCVYDYYMRLALPSPGRHSAGDGTLAPVGASGYPGASLHGYVLNQQGTASGIGEKRVPIPVNQIQPQVFTKTVSGSRGTGNTWAVTKSAGTAEFPNSCTGDTQVGVQVTVSWTKTASVNGQTNVTTTFKFDNPAHRNLIVGVHDVLYTSAAKTTQLDSFDFSPPNGGILAPGHHEFSVTRAVTIDPAVTSLYNTATATYTDPVTNSAFGAIEATASGSITTGIGTNATATITDSETITGDHLAFSVAAPSVGSFSNGYTAGDRIDQNGGSVDWSSGSQSGSGSVTFDKTVYVDQGATTSGSIDDTATLTPSDASASTASASVPISATGCATVNGHKYNDLNGDGTDNGGTDPGLSGFTFYVDYNGNGALETTGSDPEPSAISDANGNWQITGVKPGTYDVREIGQAGWTCTQPAPDCSYSIDADGAVVPATLVFGNSTPPPPVAQPPAPVPTVPQQQVQGQRVVHGAAHIAGKTGCIAKRFKVSISGKQISYVVFRIDGRRIRTIRTANKSGKFVLTVDPRKFKAGSHLVTAKSVFKASSQTPSKTLRLRFARCVKRTLPAFTG